MRSKKDNDRQWETIKRLDWAGLPKVNNVRYLLKKLDRYDYERLKTFVEEKVELLHEQYKDDWLANPGIGVSDDGWWDLRAEIVGRGREFYENITVKKMREMADKNDYTENFQYGFNI